MNKPIRKRNNTVTVRMNDTEYADLHNRVDESGLSIQAYIINAIRGATIVTPDEVAEVKEISKTFADLERQLRGLATNINQLAHVANGQGNLPTVNYLKQLSAQLTEYRKECEDIWQSIRLSIKIPSHMVP